jgi:3-oxoacyl-[acyl-carrier protein] reductase
VQTEGVASAGVEGSDFLNSMIQQTPLGRIGQPKDIAEAVAYLASDDAGWLTGSLIEAAGGLR